MEIHLKRAYAAPSEKDGRRILVDRLWPRGIKKEELDIDFWMKEVAPSSELRRRFGHDPQKWEEFRSRYFRELDERPDAVEKLMEEAKKGPVTLVFAAKNERHNNAVALAEYLKKI